LTFLTSLQILRAEGSGKTLAQARFVVDTFVTGVQREFKKYIKDVLESPSSELLHELSIVETHYRDGTWCGRCLASGHVEKAPSGLLPRLMAIQGRVDLDPDRAIPPSCASLSGWPSEIVRCHEICEDMAAKLSILRDLLCSLVSVVDVTAVNVETHYGHSSLVH
jgi:hypothetical protein